MWSEWQCLGSPQGCPCTYDSPLLICMRGFCPDTDLEYKRYAMTQPAADPQKIILVGFGPDSLQLFTQPVDLYRCKAQCKTLERQTQPPVFIGLKKFSIFHLEDLPNMWEPPHTFGIFGKFSNCCPGDRFACCSGRIPLVVTSRFLVLAQGFHLRPSVGRLWPNFSKG